jgi:hypothetical protein
VVSSFLGGRKSTRAAYYFVTYLFAGFKKRNQQICVYLLVAYLFADTEKHPKTQQQNLSIFVLKVDIALLLNFVCDVFETPSPRNIQKYNETESNEEKVTYLTYDNMSFLKKKAFFDMEIL